MNFASAYQQHGVEAHLHAVRQEPEETLRTFISRFTKVQGTIPRISDASIITAFRQGVRDEKMLEKLATHDVETVTMLFALADKCARATEGRAWHSTPQTPTGARIQAGVPLASVGCAALADHLRAPTWPSKFRPHLPEKYDGTSNPSEFLQVYVTASTEAGGDTAVMETYFHVALSGPARTWLMNLTPGSICSWEELCARFAANFTSAYQWHGVEAHLHAVRQESGETLQAFISRFTKVGRALCAVRSELHQCLSVAWRGGSPPCSEAGIRGNSPGFHLSLY